jgi:hypothetical protein
MIRDARAARIQDSKFKIQNSRSKMIRDARAARIQDSKFKIQDQS